MSIQVIIFLAGFLAISGIGAIAYVFLGSAGGRQREMRGLMSSATRAGDPFSKDFDQPEVDAAVEEIKRRSGHAVGKSAAEDAGRKLFRAGYYTKTAKKRFRLARIITPIVFIPLCFIIMKTASGNLTLAALGAVIGAFIGFVAPLSWLDREIRKREEEIMYYLPLVIEQISIGVSSSLDIGPCIAQVVTMADERDSHNPVTEMFIHIEKLIRSGLNLEDALFEVGEASGMADVKHAFMFLGQCAKHGGEVSRQLQELADAVMVQRQVQVEGRIASLPVHATGPLTMVFAGFFALLLAGLFVRLMEAFGK